MFVVCRSAYPIFCKPSAIHSTRSMATWHCIYYKHLNAGMSWHSQVATKVAEAVEGKKAIVYMHKPQRTGLLLAAKV